VYLYIITPPCIGYRAEFRRSKVLGQNVWAYVYGIAGTPSTCIGEYDDPVKSRTYVTVPNLDAQG